MEISYRDKRRVNIYPSATNEPDVPVIFLLAGDEDGKRVWELARELTTQPFSLAVVGVEDWNRDLSPWAAKNVFRGVEDFGGCADEFLQELESEIVPSVLEELRADAPCILAGYSLAGLCAVYALYQTRVFSGVISASGSLWFPGFTDYTETQDFERKPDKVYFSLGDKESHTKNQTMKLVEENTRFLCKNYSEHGIRTTFEMNPGNHFQDAELRLAKGITWMLSSR